jgi:hypothetical protein
MAWTGLYPRLRQKRSPPFGPVLFGRAYPFLKPHPNQLFWLVRPNPTPGWLVALHDYADGKFVGRHSWKFRNAVLVRFEFNFLLFFSRFFSAPINQGDGGILNRKISLRICDFETALIACFLGRFGLSVSPRYRAVWKRAARDTFPIRSMCIAPKTSKCIASHYMHASIRWCVGRRRAQFRPFMGRPQNVLGGSGLTRVWAFRR